MTSKYYPITKNGFLDMFRYLSANPDEENYNMAVWLLEQMFELGIELDQQFLKPLVILNVLQPVIGVPHETT